MPSLDFDQEELAFRQFHSSNRQLFESAAQSFKALINSLVTESFPVDSISSRVKDCDECINKFKRKYRAELEEKKTAYEIKNHISDLIGVRVVCLYESDIQPIRQVLEQNFEVLGITDKISLMDSTDDQFGYKGLHLDLRLNQERRNLPEYKKFADLAFEVQIRTIIQDAWGVLDHKIKYKKSIPPSLKRRINRLAALFEVADAEFLRIKKETEQLQKEAEVIVEQPAPPGVQVDDNLDVFKFLIATKSKFPHYEFIPFKVDGFVQEIRALSPSFQTFQFKDALVTHWETVNDYRSYQASLMNNLNPYTMIRHILYLTDREVFGKLLFDLQRSNFEKWLSQSKPDVLHTGA